MVYAIKESTAADLTSRSVQSKDNSEPLLFSFIKEYIWHKLRRRRNQFHSAAYNAGMSRIKTESVQLKTVKTQCMGQVSPGTNRHKST